MLGDSLECGRARLLFLEFKSGGAVFADLLSAESWMQSILRPHTPLLVSSIIDGVGGLSWPRPLLGFRKQWFGFEEEDGARCDARS